MTHDEPLCMNCKNYEGCRLCKEYGECPEKIFSGEDCKKYKAKEKNDAYILEYAQMINKFTGEFIQEYCSADGRIDWEKIVKLNAAIKEPVKKQ